METICKYGIIIPPEIDSELYLRENIDDYSILLSRILPEFPTFENLNLYTDVELFEIFGIYVPYRSRKELLLMLTERSFIPGIFVLTTQPPTLVYGTFDKYSEIMSIELRDDGDDEVNLITSEAKYLYPKTLTFRCVYRYPDFVHFANEINRTKLSFEQRMLVIRNNLLIGNLCYSPKDSSFHQTVKSLDKCIEGLNREGWDYILPLLPTIRKLLYGDQLLHEDFNVIVEYHSLLSLQ